MRKILLALIFLVATSGAFAAEKTGMFAIEKMTCALCPVTVRKAMSSVSGVKAVTVDFERKLATVVFEDGETATDTIAEASKNSGYPATLIQVTP
jgi:periplasmic mercuric ion binding protein